MYRRFTNFFFFCVLSVYCSILVLKIFLFLFSLFLSPMDLR